MDKRGEEWTGEQPVEVDVSRDRLAASLPTYMVPSAFHCRDSLPLWTAEADVPCATVRKAAGVGPGRAGTMNRREPREC
jgi:hypothetical protein